MKRLLALSIAIFLIALTVFAIHTHAQNAKASVTHVQAPVSVPTAKPVTVTFPIAFPTAVLQIQLGAIGAKTTTAPTAITDFNVGIGGEIVLPSVSTLSASAVTIQVYKNVNFSSATTYYGIWWRVVGN